MSEYPDWVEIVRFVGLDPITVWIEYRNLLFLSLFLIVVLLIGGIYFAALRLRGTIANYKHSFADKMAFYRSVQELESKYHEPIKKALNGEPVVYLIPAIAAEDVKGFRKSVGHILLTRTRLIFACGDEKIDYDLLSFRDANVRDGNKIMELKLIFDDSKPIFHLLGISRDHAQELFMKMHAFRLALKEAEQKS